MKPFSRLIGMLILCAIVVACYGIWYASISAKSTTVADLERSIITKTEAVNRIAATRSTLTDIAEDEAKVQSHFVPEAGIVSFIDTLEALARARSATLKILSVATAGTTARPELTLSVSITGSFDALMRTIGSIEYSSYDLSVSTLSLAKKDTGVWQTNLTLRVGSLPPERTQ